MNSCRISRQVTSSVTESMRCSWPRLSCPRSLWRSCRVWQRSTGAPATAWSRRSATPSEPAASGIADMSAYALQMMISTCPAALRSPAHAPCFCSGSDRSTSHHAVMTACKQKPAMVREQRSGADMARSLRPLMLPGWCRLLLILATGKTGQSRRLPAAAASQSQGQLISSRTFTILHMVPVWSLEALQPSVIPSVKLSCQRTTNTQYLAGLLV